MFIIPPFSFPNWQRQENLAYRDAGMAFNVPLPPLLEEERAVDIIVVVDVSGDLHTDTCGNELIKAAIWAQRCNKPFPISPKELIDLRKKGELKKPQIFQYQTKSPVVVYVPIRVEEQYMFSTYAMDTTDTTKKQILFQTTEKLWNDVREHLKIVVTKML